MSNSEEKSANWRWPRYVADPDRYRREQSRRGRRHGGTQHDGGRYEEIRRRLAEGRGLREIARALNCSRDTVREVRDGARQSPDAPKPLSDPLWMLQLDWPAIVHDLGLGHPLKFIWRRKAQHLTTYSNLWKQFYR